MNPQDTIQCRAVVGAPLSASEPWKQGEPVKFIYAPAGVHTITAGFRQNDAITVTLLVDEHTPAALQKSFDTLAASSKQEPFGDEEHDSKKATLRFPKDKTTFEWGNLNGDSGVLVAAEPTSYGAASVNGKDYRSWSPEFHTDADYSKATCLKCASPAKVCKCSGCHFGFPEGVRGSASNPARIVGVNHVMGALTNRPAFREMPAVKARQAAEAAATVQSASGAYASGHEFHGNQYTKAANAAWQASEHAGNASMMANKGDAKHDDAMQKHQHAASLHQLAEKYATIDSIKKFHHDMAQHHLKGADYHLKAVDTTKATADTSRETVQAADGTGPKTAAEILESIAAKRQPQPGEPLTLETIFASIAGKKGQPAA